MKIHSLHWAIALSLFLGGLGVPVPENPFLLGGGYAISQEIITIIPGLTLWYVAIICGDLALFGFFRWAFSRPSLLRFALRFIRQDRLEKYQAAFLRKGGWMLFLARFTFGIRAVAYIAAGIAHYPLRRFLLVDGASVGIQVMLFVGIGSYAGENIEWAKATAQEIAVLLVGVIVLTICLSLGAMAVLKKFTRKAS